jgi:hypothetical protein
MVVHGLFFLKVIALLNSSHYDLHYSGILSHDRIGNALTHPEPSFAKTA